MWIEARLTHKLTKSILSAQADSIKSQRHKKIRTACALRGGASGKIRECAARRHLSISDFVAISLRVRETLASSLTKSNGSAPESDRVITARSTEHRREASEWHCFHSRADSTLANRAGFGWPYPLPEQQLLWGQTAQGG